MNYFVISSDEDGTRVEPMDEATLKQRLNEKWWGDDAKFFDHVPRSKGCFIEGDEGTLLIIIKGEVVVPKAKKVVEEYEIP